MNELNAKAIYDKVLVKVLKEDEKTVGGLFVPESAKSNLKPQIFAEVLSVGELVNEIKEGDVIMCNKHGGMDIILERHLCKVLKCEEIYGVMPKEEK